ncbi:glutathione S-transferase family protein [Sedimenticola sp.]|uniref:glutathione S-transferase family protein n=1 Tax=Sedimenticola sp. TaxID=1940285 RepID=UPI003D0F113E
MKLFYVNGSPNCRKVHAVLNHLGLQIDIEYLDFFDGDLASAEFGEINPNRMVPVLVDGDLNLWESNAINQYLADQVPGNTLFPWDQKSRADIVRWLCWELAHYNQALGTLSFETVAKPNFLGQEPNQPLVGWCIERLNLYAPVLETHLQERDYLVGDGLTLADYAVAHVEMFVDAVPFDWTDYPNITAYYQRMRDNPHWANTAVKPEVMGRRPF